MYSCEKIANCFQVPIFSFYNLIKEMALNRNSGGQDKRWKIKKNIRELLVVFLKAGQNCHLTANELQEDLADSAQWSTIEPFSNTYTNMAFIN